MKRGPRLITMTISIFTLVAAACVLGAVSAAHAGAECNGWGELRGLRVDGELVPVRTTLVVASSDWKKYGRTAHWRTRDSKYERLSDGALVVSGRIGWADPPTLSFRKTIRDIGPGRATLDVEATVDVDVPDAGGVFLFVSVPASTFGAGSGELLDPQPAHAPASTRFTTTRPTDDRQYLRAEARGVRFSSARRTVVARLHADAAAAPFVLQDDRAGGEDQLTAYFPLHTGPLRAGESFRAGLTLEVSGEPDRAIATVQIDGSDRGPAFAGVGGNFCWGTGSPVVDFYLDNLLVRWGRVNMALHRWQPDERITPATRPAFPELHDEIREGLRVGKLLRSRGIPMIISCWTAPDWALLPRTDEEVRRAPSPKTARIRPEKLEALAESVAAYLGMFRAEVGAEPELFCFNEPNLGINVLMSPEEHRDAIKVLGRAFESAGLRTRLLLGDANEPRDVGYVLPSLNDPEAMRYVGGVSYHSWNGATDEQLITWRRHAARAGVPLFVAEAGTDPDAHRYGALRDEPWYGLDEIALYLRCISLSRPLSILHWQLTTDYGFVRPREDAQSAAEGAATDTKMRLSQRWWQYKQLDAMTPPDSDVLGASSDHREVTVAALAARGSELSVIHLVNTGAARPVRLIGVPPGVIALRKHVTDELRGMVEIDEPVTVTDGTASLVLPSESYVSLIPTN